MLSTTFYVLYVHNGNLLYTALHISVLHSHLSNSRSRLLSTAFVALSTGQAQVLPQTDTLLTFDNSSVLITHPCEHFESIDTIIHCSLYVIHQIVCGSTNEDSRNGTILLFCSETCITELIH